MTTEDWWSAGQRWLIQRANEHFSNWVKTKAAARWRRNRKKSPYYCGYSQPQWMEDAREALGRNDEVAFKAIKMAQFTGEST